LRGGNHHDDDHHKGDDHQRGGDHKGGDHKRGGDHHKGRRGENGPTHHIIRVLIAISMWLVLVAPLVGLMRRFTWLKWRINKINSKCTEAQRAEVSRRIVQNMQKPCAQACATEAKPCKSSDKLANKAAKLKAKLAKITAKMSKKQQP